MAERTNRRDLILNTSAELFRKQGYATTSVRQIAEAVGVTEAALYYHFKDGKRELLKEVFECEMPDLNAVLEHCNHVTSLPEFVQCFGSMLAAKMPKRLESFRWILAEYPKLTEEERSLFHNKHMAFQKSMNEVVSRFIDDPDEARYISWMILLTFFGYGQMFVGMELSKVCDFAPQQLVQTLANVLSAYINSS